MKKPVRRRRRGRGERRRGRRGRSKRYGAGEDGSFVDRSGVELEAQTGRSGWRPSRRCWSTTRSRRRRRATWRRRPASRCWTGRPSILEIFRRHARSRAAKAQVEIVRLQYMAPRLREQGKGRGPPARRHRRQGRGRVEPGARPPQDPRSHRRADARAGGAGARSSAPSAPAASDMSRVALVGYTNAGKSTLMRALTGSEVYVADKLFATLDTTVRPLAPGDAPARAGLGHGRLHRQAAARPGGLVQEHARRGAGGGAAAAGGRRLGSRTSSASWR